jgi:hypothetical protein
MSSRRKELSYGDTLNTLKHEYQEFQWLQAYNYYKSLPPTEKNMYQVWTSCIALASCVPEVINFKELVQWCADKFSSNKRIIHLQRQ